MWSPSDERAHADRDDESNGRVRDHDRPLARPQVQHVAERVARQERIPDTSCSAQRSPPRQGGASLLAHAAHVDADTSSCAMRSPISVRYGSTISNLQNGWKTVARPPVATTNGTTGRGHSP